jgi:hypothetical protein
MKKINFGKVFYFICLLAISLLFSYYGQPLIHGNQDAIGVLVTVFSILAGFLIAVITLVGDPKSLPAGSWRAAQLGSEKTYKRLIKKKWLFISYLITLALIFISILIKARYPNVSVYIEYAFMFFGCISGMFSFQLPSALIVLQEERIQNEIEERRRNAGITNQL